MRGLERRLARLEATSAAGDEALVSPETLMRMAAVHDAECALIRERLLADGPHAAVETQHGVESDARRRLREKLLRDDPPPVEAAHR